MLRELVHLCRHAPGTLWLKATRSQAELYQTVLRRGEAAGLGARRAALVRDLAGEVLEIGCGTGLMFPHFPAGARVAAIEPDREFLGLARAAATHALATVRVQAARAEALPFAAARFDAAVIALVLCSVPAPERALAEVKRVLKPGGALRVIEHVRSEGRIAGALMDLLNPLWRWANGQGCNMNRRSEATLRAAGFRVERSEAFQLFIPGLPAFPFRAIRALRD